MDEETITIVLQVRADMPVQDVASQAVAVFLAAQPVPPVELEQPPQGEGWGIGPQSEVGVPGIRVFDIEQPTEAQPSELAGAEGATGEPADEPA